MKFFNFSFGILFILVLFSCSKNENEYRQIKGESGTSFSDSKDAWIELKAINGESYRYTTSFISWSGYGSRTVLSVKDGLISKREYLYFQQTFNEEGEMIEVEIESYTETGDQIGRNAEGFEPLLIDQLYETCISEYLKVSREQHEVFFNTDQAGLISDCGFFEKGCVDDCFTGFKISEFNWL
ncbi:hypothetical protein DET49_11114 [Salegentibacter sp. 24]|uniref:hypothetical protein n=1 Tax=Salegentibacter sp. 24 TaxID=2183986 RepID=UPI00105B51CD|nr:hypothetical protein [Salegentibacter sp. 24]TDN87566.1 hypothetical protein DET49_11114 [Salegentibacter sp. 24]